jgi:hypothetical protein
MQSSVAGVLGVDPNDAASVEQCFIDTSRLLNRVPEDDLRIARAITVAGTQVFIDWTAQTYALQGDVVQRLQVHAATLDAHDARAFCHAIIRFIEHALRTIRIARGIAPRARRPIRPNPRPNN